MSRTRLLHVSSEVARQAGGTYQSSSEFVVPFGNHSPEFTQIRGISVESCSFLNLIDNVREGRTALTVQRNGVETTFNIAPGFYDIESLALEIQGAFDSLIPAVAPGDFAITVVEGAGEEGGDRLSIQYLAALPVQFIIYAEANSLSYYMGLESNIEWSTIPLEYLLQTKLSGETDVQLWTKSLINDQSSVNSFGRAIPSVSTIPLQNGYGLNESFYVYGEERPTIRYRAINGVPLDTIDFSLRYSDGGVVDLKGATLHVSIRLWL